jgi:hypothetical protein
MKPGDPPPEFGWVFFDIMAVVTAVYILGELLWLNP